jgi:hypothetical protein
MSGRRDASQRIPTANPYVSAVFNQLKRAGLLDVSRPMPSVALRSIKQHDPQVTLTLHNYPRSISSEISKPQKLAHRLSERTCRGRHAVLSDCIYARLCAVLWRPVW